VIVSFGTGRDHGVLGDDAACMRSMDVAWS
jgi:hypothetical protein